MMVDIYQTCLRPYLRLNSVTHFDREIKVISDNPALSDIFDEYQESHFHLINQKLLVEAVSLQFR